MRRRGICRPGRSRLPRSTGLYPQGNQRLVRVCTSGPKAARLARKYPPFVPVRADRVARPDAPAAPGQGSRPGQLCTAQERFAALTASAEQGSRGARAQILRDLDGLPGPRLGSLPALPR